tara:strand:+ start:578 stop:796 length:219 start_codon:yes stop_codon:yes gene_type:complete
MPSLQIKLFFTAQSASGAMNHPESTGTNVQNIMKILSVMANQEKFVKDANPTKVRMHKKKMTLAWWTLPCRV